MAAQRCTAGLRWEKRLQNIREVQESHSPKVFFWCQFRVKHLTSALTSGGSRPILNPTIDLTSRGTYSIYTIPYLLFVNIPYLLGLVPISADLGLSQNAGCLNLRERDFPNHRYLRCSKFWNAPISLMSDD